MCASISRTCPSPFSQATGVFPCWWEFGRFYKKEKGIYVPDNELVRLSLIPFEERRKTNFWFDIFVDVRKYGWEGVFKMENEKWKHILEKNVCKKPVRRNRINNIDNENQMGLWN